MRSFLTILITCIHSLAVAQYSGARSIAMGDLFLGLSDFFSAVKNRAMLAEIKSVSAGVTLKNNFLIKNLSTSALAVAMPIGKGAAALYFDTYGYQLYRRYQLSLSYGLALSPRFSMGAAVNYHAIQLGDGLGMEAAFYPDIGLNFQPVEKLNIAILFQNLTFSPQVKQLDELWPVAGRLGLMVHINEKLIVGAQANVYLEQPFDINSGLEYRVSELLFLRLGFASQPARFSMGFGLMLGKVKVDLAGSYQNTPGFTPSIGLVFENGN